MNENNFEKIIIVILILLIVSFLSGWKLSIKHYRKYNMYILDYNMSHQENANEK